MQLEVVTITQENIESFVGLYIDVFNRPPWNDGWSETAVLERFRSFATFPRFRGLGYLSAGSPSALVFGWGERWTTSWNFHIREMCVAVPLQRGGFGKGLLIAFEQQLFSEGFKSVFLETGQAAPARPGSERLS